MVKYLYQIFNGLPDMCSCIFLLAAILISCYFEYNYSS